MTNGLRRWRLVLGESSQCHGGGAGAGADGLPIELMDDDAQMDKVLEPFTTPTAPPDWAARARNVNRWLGDIRTYFPKSVVQSCSRTHSND